MNYKIFYYYFSFLIFSCANQNFNKKNYLDEIIFKKYSNNGFTLVYKMNYLKKKVK